MTTPASSSLASPTRFLLVLGCFVLSGSAGLMYETAWTQEFALVFGTSDLAVSAVLAAYMAGLMVGARLAESLLPRVRRPLRAYAVLELLIAAAALAVPPAIGLSRHLYVALFSTPQLTEFQGTGAAVFYLLTAFLALLLPTAMMGATLPLLVRYAVGRDAEIGRRVGLLYGANTLGAAAGTLITAFVLLPRLGLDRTVWVAIGVNLTVFALAILLARTSGDGSAAAGDADGVAAAPAREGVDGARIVLPIMLVSGAVAFGWEVLWTRLLSHLLGGSVYAFGLMLATFLTGLALGAWIASRLAHSARRAGAAFALAQLGIALSSWIAFALADALPGWLAGRSALELGWASAVAAVTLLPGAVFMGATFPLAVRLLARHPDEAASVSARVYVWNTCGTIFGAVGTGFVLLPTLRFAGTATLLVVVGTLLAALAAWRLSEALGMRRATYALVAAALIAVVVRPPAPPWSLLRTAPLSGQIAQGEVTFYAVGRSSTVLLTEEPPGWRLTNNGLPESMIQPPASLGHPLTVARWLSMLPIVSRPAAESMLIVGLGGGLTVEAVPASVADVHVVELEPEVVAANRQLAGERARDPLDDPRVTVHLNDARGALMLTGRTFDAIVSQPSHPWTAGASHLFTREFFALVDAHLAPDGVFVQWIGLRFVDASLLRSLIATLLDVFPHVEVYEPSPGGSLIFLAGQQALEVAPKAAALMRSDDPARAAWLRLGMAAPEDFLAAQRFDVDAARRFAGDAALVTDRRNLLKSRSARLRTGRLDSRFLAQLLAGEAAVDPSLPAERDALRIVQRHLRQPGGALTAAAIADAPSTPPRVRQAAHALIALAQGDGGAGPALERLLPAPGVALDRAGQEALYALMLRRRPAVTRQQAGAWATQIASDPVAAMIAEGWRLAALRKPGVLRARDAALARVPAAHTLFPAALELRVVWRQASGDAARLAEAYDLMALRMVHGVGQPAGHLRRARLAAQLGDPVRLRASMLDLRASMARREAPGVRRAVARLVADLPPELQRVARAALGEAVR